MFYVYCYSAPEHSASHTLIMFSIFILKLMRWYYYLKSALHATTCLYLVATEHLGEKGHFGQFKISGTAKGGLSQPLVLGKAQILTFTNEFLPRC